MRRVENLGSQPADSFVMGASGGSPARPFGPGGCKEGGYVSVGSNMIPQGLHRILREPESNMIFPGGSRWLIGLNLWIFGTRKKDIVGNLKPVRENGVMSYREIRIFGCYCRTPCGCVD
jgi:hypothetical protein